MGKGSIASDYLYWNDVDDSRLCWQHIVGLTVFGWASWQQYSIHAQFAQLRRSSKTRKLTC